MVGFLKMMLAFKMQKPEMLMQVFMLLVIVR